MTDTDDQPNDVIFYIRCPAHSARKAEIIKLAAEVDGRSKSAFLLHYGYLAASLVLKRNRKMPKRPKAMPMNKMGDALVKQILDRSFAEVLKNTKKRRKRKVLFDSQPENQ